MPTVACPHCSAKLRITDRMAGRRIRCPGCGTEITDAADAVQRELTAEVIPSVGVAAGEAVAAPWIGLAGAAILLIGAFLPIVRVPIIGTINYVGDGRGDGIIIAVLAGLAACASLGRWYRGLWAVALLALAVMSFTFTQFQMRIGQDRVFVQLEWGWAVLAVGVITSVAAAATGQATRNRPRAAVILSLAAVSLICTTAVSAWLTWGIPTAVAAYEEAQRRASQRAAEETSRESARIAQEEAQRREAARLRAEREAARQAAERDAAKRDALRDQTKQELIALDARGRKPDQPLAADWADATTFKVRQSGICAAVTALALDGGLTIDVTVENVGPGSLSFQPWGRITGKDEPELIDSQGRRFRRRPGDAPGTQVTLRPGDRYEDRLTFAGVTDKAEHVGLELPAGAFGGYGKLRLRIPRSMLVLKTAAARGAAAVPGLIGLLDDPAPRIRIDTLALLTRVGPAARGRVDAVADRLADADREVRQAAKATVQAMAPFGREDVPKLKSLLQRRPVEIREFAIRTLSEMGAQAASASPELIEALQDESVAIREVAASALGKIGSVSSEAAPALVKALDDGNATVRLIALRSLAAMPPDAGNADVLVKAIRHSDEAVARAAADAVGRYSLVGKQHVPDLIEALRRAPQSTRAGIVIALRRIGGDARDAIPALVDALSDRDPAMRKQLVDVLATFGSAALPAVPTLGRLLSDNNAEAKRAAAEALGGLGRFASGAAPELVIALKDQTISAQAETSLIRIGPAAASAVLDALENSKKVPHDLRLKMISLLAKMGNDAKGVLPNLDAIATSDPIASVRRAAAEAADSIRKKQ